jgi:hypothetical protein
VREQHLSAATGERMATRKGPGPRAARFVALTLLVASTSLRAEDWPQWRGNGRLAVWSEAGLLDRFPESGLKVTWRVPVHAGYSGPAVASGRVFVTDGRRMSNESWRSMSKPAGLSGPGSGTPTTQAWR